MNQVVEKRAKGQKKLFWENHYLPIIAAFRGI